MNILNPSCDGENFIWDTEGNAEWPLTAIYENERITSFEVGDECPYFNDGYTIAIRQNDNVMRGPG